MRPALVHDAVLENDDLIRVHDGREVLPAARCGGASASGLAAGGLRGKQELGGSGRGSLRVLAFARRRASGRTCAIMTQVCFAPARLLCAWSSRKISLSVTVSTALVASSHRRMGGAFRSAPAGDRPGTGSISRGGATRRV